MKCDVCGQEAKRVETKLHQTWGDMPALRWECPATENMDGRSHWVRWDRVVVNEDATKPVGAGE